MKFFRLGRPPLRMALRVSSLPAAAFTLIEVMVAMTLLVVIIAGLVASLNQTQKALKLASGQTDTMENGRAFMQLLTREMQEIVSFPEEITTTFRFASKYRNVNNPLMQDVPGLSDQRTNLLSSFAFVTRSKELNQYRLVMYDVHKDEMENQFATGIYRAETNFPIWGVTNDLLVVENRFLNWQLAAFRDTNFFSKVLDGVVHLQFHSYDTNGARIPDWNLGTGRLVGYTFTNSSPSQETNFFAYRPSSIELELGVLDPEVVTKVKSMTNTVANKFLLDRSGSVQVFRQRITVPTGP